MSGNALSSRDAVAPPAAGERRQRDEHRRERSDDGGDHRPGVVGGSGIGDSSVRRSARHPAGPVHDRAVASAASPVRAPSVGVPQPSTGWAAGPAGRARPRGAATARRIRTGVEVSVERVQALSHAREPDRRTRAVQRPSPSCTTRRASCATSGASAASDGSASPARRSQSTDRRALRTTSSRALPEGDRRGPARHILPGSGRAVIITSCSHGRVSRSSTYSQSRPAQRRASLGTLTTRRRPRRLSGWM